MIETPETARLVAPLVPVLEVLAAAPVLVAVVTTPSLPVETTIDIEPDGGRLVGRGRAVKISALEWVTQLDEAGMRAV